MPRAGSRSPLAWPPHSFLRLCQRRTSVSGESSTPPRSPRLQSRFVQPSPASSTPPGHRRTLSATLMEERITAAAAIVEKWHPERALFAGCSLFFDSRGEADAFLRAAADLHRAMLSFVSDVVADDGGDGLMRAQALLESAMRRLELELHLLLTSLSDSTDDKNRHDEDTAADIRAVAEAMVAAGYGKECVSAYKSRRHAAVDAAVLRLLGFSPANHTQLHKLSWDQVDTKLRSWLAAAPSAFKFLFPGERRLCDTVFASDTTVCDAVFSAIANEQAMHLLAIAETAATRARRAPERLFRVLDLHDTIAELLPAIVSVFGLDSEPATRAAAALTKIAESARAAITCFEAAIQKEPSRAAAPGGAVHPLTRYVVNYLVFLADYEEAVTDIYADVQFVDMSVSGNASPELLLLSPSSSSSSNPIARLVFVLLCKLDVKAASYREAALSYLFLANNVHYIAKKVASSKLEKVLGEEWTAAHKAKARRYVDAYVRAAWGGVTAAIAAADGEDGVEEEVEEAVAAQEEWAVADAEIAEAVRVAATALVVPTYRLFYRRYGAAVRLTPGDVNEMITTLFGGRGAKVSGSGSGPGACKSPGRTAW